MINSNVYACKISLYAQFVTLETSSILRCLTCVDRYFTILPRYNVTKRGKLKKRYHGTVKSVNLWTTVVFIFLCLLHLHIPLLAGENVERYKLMPLDEQVIENNNTNNFNDSLSRIIDKYGKLYIEKQFIEFDCYQTKYYNIRPMWNRVHMTINSILPCIIMFSFDILLLYRTYLVKRRMIGIRIFNKIADTNRRRLTLSLICITTSYLVMTLPVSFVHSFYLEMFYLESPNGINYIFLLAALSAYPHCLIFFECYLTNSKFRHVFNDYLRKFFCKIEPILTNPFVDNRIYETVM